MTGHPSRAILVLGMHRSGTSAVTRVLNLLGADLGRRIMPPMPGSNEKGFWENLDAVDLDDRVLTGLGRSWHDVRDMPAGWLLSAPAAEGAGAIKALIQAEFVTAPLWAVKDPRMCRLAPLWLEVLAECGVEPHVLFVIRHPLEVAASLHARDGWPGARSLLLWLQHVLEAERATRGCRRVMITYDQVLGDWSRSVEHVAATLGVAWPRAVQDARAEIEAFLDSGARHHAHAALPDAPTHSPGMPPLVGDVYEQCVRVSANTGDWRDLEASADDFHRFSALYGAVFDDFIGFANRVTGRVQHAGTIPEHARPEPDALVRQSREVSLALTVASEGGADLAAIRRSLALHAGLVERLGRAAEAQWARIASLESLLFAEHQSLRAVLAGESHRIRSTLLAELETLRSAIVDESHGLRSELQDSAHLAHEMEKLAQVVANQADAIRSLQDEVAGVRRGLVMPMLRRWFGRSDA